MRTRVQQHPNAELARRGAVEAIAQPSQWLDEMPARAAGGLDLDGCQRAVDALEHDVDFAAVVVAQVVDARTG